MRDCNVYLGARASVFGGFVIGKWVERRLPGAGGLTQVLGTKNIRDTNENVNPDRNANCKTIFDKLRGSSLAGECDYNGGSFVSDACVMQYRYETIRIAFRQWCGNRLWNVPSMLMVDD